MWSNFPMNSQRTLKKFFGYLVGYIAEYILKETSMSGSGIFWAHCRVLFEFDQKVIAGQIVIELMGTFEKQSQFAQWSICGQIDGHIQKAITIYPLVKMWANWWAHLKSNHNLPTG